MENKQLKSLRLICTACLMVWFTNCSDQAKSQQPPAVDRETRKIQIALLLDTSNSMDGLINQAKSQLWTIVNELAKARCDNSKPELQIALYEYGNDNQPSSENYIRMVTPLTSDLDKISEDLFKLTTYGGDEFCGAVIQKCLKQLGWSKSSKDLQLIYIAGNEPFIQGNISYTASCQDAKEKNVIVNTIFCGDFDEGIRTEWKKGADLTGGTYASIEQNHKTIFIESPYDQKISELNNKLNNTYIPYGTNGTSYRANQLAQDNNAKAYGNVNYVKRTVSKSSHVYSNKTWDLVDASKDESFDVEKLKESELPAEMQKMNTTEKKVYIEQKNVERQQIIEEIQVLNKKRETYVAEQTGTSDESDMLDKAMISTIRKKAQERNFVIE